MEPDETMVEENFGDEAADDTLPEGIAEAGDESQSLDEFEEIQEEPADEPVQQDRQDGTSEPGWFKKRWASSVEKLTNQIRSEVRDEYEAQIAPLRERLIEMDAQELVRSHKVADIETARELIRLRQGLPGQQAEMQEQPRNEKGQFSSQESAQSVHQERITKLQNQADAIAAMGGPDVRSEFMNNEDVKMKVIRGEMDFIDLAKQMQKPSKKPPAPTRSPNGASGSEKSSIGGMSREAFARFEKKISEGARYTIK